MEKFFVFNHKCVRQAALLSMLLLIVCTARAQFTVSGTTTNNTSSGPIYISSFPYNSEPPIYIGKGLNPGSANTSVGVAALSSTTNTGVGAYSNTAIGFNALKLGSYIKANTAIGANALDHANNTAGGVDGNTVVGNMAMTNFGLGANNTAMGNSALAGIRTGSAEPYTYTSTGSNNSAFGAYSLSGVVAGTYNVGIGFNAQVINNTSATTADNNYQLSIQNVIYGRDMQAGSTHGNVSVGAAPAVTAAGSIIPGVYAKLRVAGNNTGNLSTSTPSLQLDYVPVNGGATPTPNPTGRYLFRDAGGVICEAPIPASGTTTHTFTNTANTITSEVNGIIRTAPAVNTVVNTITSGSLVTTVNGVASASVVLPVSNTNIYTSNGVINQATTTGVNRVVDMNDRNIWFNTVNSPTNGKIYIGSNSTTTPAVMFPTATGNYRLYVEGGILTEKVKVAVRASANWADYVFADSYTLMPIQELASFVKANKHLPGILAADNLVKEGLDLGEMQAKQMGKIEELTLYIIEQNNKLDKQQFEIEALKAQVKNLLEKSK